MRPDWYTLTMSQPPATANPRCGPNWLQQPSSCSPGEGRDPEVAEPAVEAMSRSPLPVVELPRFIEEERAGRRFYMNYHSITDTSRGCAAGQVAD